MDRRVLQVTATVADEEVEHGQVDRCGRKADERQRLSGSRFRRERGTTVHERREGAELLGLDSSHNRSFLSRGADHVEQLLGERAQDVDEHLVCLGVVCLAVVIHLDRLSQLLEHPISVLGHRIPPIVRATLVDIACFHRSFGFGLFLFLCNSGHDWNGLTESRCFRRTERTRWR